MSHIIEIGKNIAFSCGVWPPNFRFIVYKAYYTHSNSVLCGRPNDDVHTCNRRKSVTSTYIYTNYIHTYILQYIVDRLHLSIAASESAVIETAEVATDLKEVRIEQQNSTPLSEAMATVVVVVVVTAAAETTAKNSTWTRHCDSFPRPIFHFFPI